MNLQTLSREDLVAEILGPLHAASPLGRLRVSDADTVVGSTDTTEQLLQRRPGVARELLLRDLRAQMAQGPVMSSPQVLRDWLCLH